MLKSFDRDVSWSDRKSMSLCYCHHLEKSHRPMSRKCSLCDCQGFSTDAPTTIVSGDKVDTNTPGA